MTSSPPLPVSVSLPPKPHRTFAPELPASASPADVPSTVHGVVWPVPYVAVVDIARVLLAGTGSATSPATLPVAAIVPALTTPTTTARLADAPAASVPIE